MASSGSGPPDFSQVFLTGFTTGNLNGQGGWIADPDPSLFVLAGTGLIAPTQDEYASQYPLGWAPYMPWTMTVEFLYPTQPDDASFFIDGATADGDLWGMPFRLGTRQGFDQVELVTDFGGPLIMAAAPDVPHTLTLSKPFGIAGNYQVTFDGVDQGTLAYECPNPFPLANLRLVIVRTGTESAMRVRSLAVAF